MNPNRKGATQGSGLEDRNTMRQRWKGVRGGMEIDCKSLWAKKVESIKVLFCEETGRQSIGTRGNIDKCEAGVGGVKHRAGGASQSQT